MKIPSQTDLEQGSFSETGAEHFVHYALNCAPWCRWWGTVCAEPCLPVTKAVTAHLHSRPNLTDTNGACGTAATEELNSSHSAPSHWQLNTCDHMEPIYTFVSADFCAFQPLPCISSLLSFVHFPCLVEAHKYVLVLVRPRWVALKPDYTIHVTTAAEGLHFLPKRTYTFPYLSPLYNAKPLVG